MWEGTRRIFGMTRKIASRTNSFVFFRSNITVLCTFLLPFKSPPTVGLFKGSCPHPLNEVIVKQMGAFFPPLHVELAFISVPFKSTPSVGLFKGRCCLPHPLNKVIVRQMGAFFPLSMWSLRSSPYRLKVLLSSDCLKVIKPFIHFFQNNIWCLPDRKSDRVARYL